MALLLEVIGPGAGQLGDSARSLFDAAGGTIGRQPGCTWVLPDPYISAEHARIYYRDHQYLLEDLSSNGIFVTSRENRLPKGKRYILQHGDRLFIDVFEIAVTITEPRERTQVLGRNEAPALRSPPADSATAPLQSPAEAVADALMRPGADPADFDPRAATNWEIPMSFAEPEVDVAPGGGLPDPGGFPDSTTALSGRLPAGVDFAALLAAAGLPRAHITPELSESVGKVLHVAVEGLLDALRSREAIKAEIGIRTTTFKPADNNPLKFSANAEDALHNLFVKHNAAYLSPVDAFSDAFRELRLHQQALLAATREVLLTVQATFDPENLAQEFNRRLQDGSLLPVPARLRYWDLYCEKFSQPRESVRGVLNPRWSEALSRAFNANYERLKAADPASR